MAQRERRYRQSDQEKTEYRIVYDRTSAAPRLEPVPREEPKKERRPRTPEEEERLQRNRSIARRNQQRTLVMNRTYVLFLTLVTLVCGTVCGLYVQKRADLVTNMSTVAALQSQVNELRADNDALEKRVSMSVDLDQVKAAAAGFGMAYPQDSQVVFYTVSDEDYMTLLDQE